MNKKGLMFATFTVMIVFLFVFSHIVYKTHAENKIKIKEVGLGTVDLLKQRSDSEFSNLVVEKKIELKVNDALVRFVNGEGKDHPNDKNFNELFLRYLRRDSSFSKYDFSLEDNSLVFKEPKYRYEINLNKREFITPDGIKSIDI